MPTLLQIHSSLHAGAGQSSRLAEAYVAAWRVAHPNGRVIERDLARDPLPHLDAERFGAFLSPPDARTEAQRAVLAVSDALVAELVAADVVVLGAPMYNFGIPSTLKAYFDHIARAGVTFRYGERGPVGLLTGKRVVVFATRGGVYAGTAKDSQTSYLRDFLGFLGMVDVEFVYAEGLAIGAASKQSALEAAHASIARLAALERAAA